MSIAEYLGMLTLTFGSFEHFLLVSLVWFEGCRSCHSFCAYRCLPGFMNPCMMIEYLAIVCFVLISIGQFLPHLFAHVSNGSSLRGQFHLCFNNKNNFYSFRDLAYGSITYLFEPPCILVCTSINLCLCANSLQDNKQ